MRIYAMFSKISSNHREMKEHCQNLIIIARIVVLHWNQAKLSVPIAALPLPHLQSHKLGLFRSNRWTGASREDR